MNFIDKVPPIDNSCLKILNFKIIIFVVGLLCEHGKVNPYKITKMKRISKVSWDHLYNHYRGGPGKHFFLKN